MNQLFRGKYSYFLKVCLEECTYKGQFYNAIQGLDPGLHK